MSLPNGHSLTGNHRDFDWDWRSDVLFRDHDVLMLLGAFQ